MISYSITITALEPLVLRRGMGSETRSDTVDFVSGNKILGILAGKCYGKLRQGQDRDLLLPLFHDATVNYGNAYPLHGGTICYPVPASLRVQNGHHTYTPTEGAKKKKVKEGYVHEDTEGKLRLVKVSKGERLKSARDITTRGSKDESMYLYGFVERGTCFRGSIKIFELDEEKQGKIMEQIKKLNGEHYLGTSKGEFGLVQIQLEKNKIADNPEVERDLASEIKVYAVSDLIFLNEFGAYTTRPTAEMLGFEQAEIDYAKSSLAFENIQLYNGKRQAPDASRVAIKKGSVIVLRGDQMTWDSMILKTGVGVYKQEGFGQVLLNPKFLEENREFEDTMAFAQTDGLNTLNHPSASANLTKTDKEGNASLEKILTARHEQAEKEAASYKTAIEFIEKYQPVFESINKNQWGAVRQKATLAIRAEKPKKELKRYLFTDENALLRDKANQRWKGKALKLFGDFVKEEKNTVEDVLKISVEMPKRNN